MVLWHLSITDWNGEGDAMPWDDKISRRLKLKDLQTLMAVIDAGGIGKAADRLNYSQPAVSKAIAGLERTLGKRLFERGRKGIELTPYGDAMLKCGTAVFDDLRRGVEEVEFLADPTAGEIRIACSEPVSVGIVSAIISRFVRQYPRVVFDVVLRDAFAICRDLETRSVDLVIAQTTASIDEAHMQQEILYDERVVVVAGAQHPLARKRRIAFAELTNEVWGLPPRGSFITSLIMDAFRASGLAPPRIAMFSPAYMRLMLLPDCHFLTVVPTVMLKVGARHLPIKALPIELPASRRPVALVTLKNRALSPVAQLFIEHARLLAKSMTKN
jgi:DNA-binding transcriptional LysR family regulator